MFQERFVLIFGEEGSFVLQLEIHRVPDRRKLVMIEPLGPRDDRAGWRLGTV